MFLCVCATIVLNEFGGSEWMGVSYFVNVIVFWKDLVKSDSKLNNLTYICKFFGEEENFWGPEDLKAIIFHYSNYIR